MSSDGALWAGTDGGGVAFRQAGKDTFSIMKPSNSDLLTDTTWCVRADSSGGVWISENEFDYAGTGDKQQAIVYLKDGQITRYTAEGKEGTVQVDLADSYAAVIKTDAEDNVWFATLKGLTKYDPNADTWTSWTKEDGLLADAVYAMDFDEQGGVWIGYYPEEDSSGGYHCGFDYIDSEGNISHIWQSTDSDFAKLWARDIAVAKDGSVWIITSGNSNSGGALYRINDGQVDTWSGDELFGDYLDGGDIAEIRMLEFDHDGGLWIATSMDGILYIADPSEIEEGSLTVTTQYSYDNGSWSQSNMDNVYALDIYGSTVVAGSAGGLFELIDSGISKN